MTVLLVALCIFIFSAYQLAMMIIPYYAGGEEYDKVKNLAIVSDKIGEGIEEAPKFQIDFDKLLQENPDRWCGSGSIAFHHQLSGRKECG